MPPIFFVLIHTNHYIKQSHYHNGIKQVLFHNATAGKSQKYIYVKE